MRAQSVDAIAALRREAYALGQDFRTILPLELQRLPTPIVAIARARGFRITWADWMAPSIDGAMWGDEMLIRPDRQPARRRWTIAHEMGHDALGHTVAPARVRSRKDEWAADAYAAGVLLPAAAVTACLGGQMPRQTVAAWAAAERTDHVLSLLVCTFGCSYQACWQMLVDLGGVEGELSWGVPGRAWAAYRSAWQRQRVG